MRCSIIRLFFLGLVFSGLSACASEPRKTHELTSVEATCIRETGTRVPLPEGRCVNVPGKVYTAEELRSMGIDSVGDALGMIRR